MGKVDLKSNIKDLIDSVKEIKNPFLVANRISYFVSDALKENMINLYEAYLLNWEEIKFRRKSYIESSWNGRVRISTCLNILNQRMLAQVFNDELGAAKLKKYGLEAMSLNEEKRPHYIFDRYEIFLDVGDSSILLNELVDIRNNYQNINDNNGPFHNEVFPYHFYSPEIILIKNNKNEYKKSLDEKIENLIVELNLI